MPLSLVFGLFLFHSSAFAGKDVSELTSTDPVLKGNVLPNSSYVSVETRRFAKAKAVWVNFDWLRENGFDIPADGLNPGFEQKLLDALAYGIPRETDDQSLFTSLKKTFFADKYGGTGIGSNMGSGRAASSGLVQIKGIGITPLVNKNTPIDHAHGGASLEESIREAIWGEVNHKELPYGSNRVIAIIDTGTFTEWVDGGREKRALIIREDPLRPAHFLGSIFSEESAQIKEARIKDVTNNSKQLLKPLIPLEIKSGNEVKEGFREYTKRVARQYGTAHAKRLFHSATSESNFDLHGKFLDFGTETYVPSYQPVQVLKHVEAFGKNDEIKEVLVTRFLQQYSTYGHDINSSDIAEMSRIFDDTYHETLQLELMKLTGAPPELLMEMKSTPAFQKLADSIIAYTQNEFKTPAPILMDRTMPAEVKQTRLGDLLDGCLHDSPTNQFKKLGIQMDQTIESNFSKNYGEFMDKLSEASTKHGISNQALKNYMEQGSKLVNRKVTPLERPGLMNKDIELITQYMQDGNRSPIWDEVNSRIEQNFRTYKTPNPYELVLESWTDHLTGKVNQKVYHLKTDTTTTEVRSVEELNHLKPVFDCELQFMGGLPHP